MKRSNAYTTYRQAIKDGIDVAAQTGTLDEWWNQHPEYDREELAQGAAEYVAEFISTIKDKPPVAGAIKKTDK